MKNKSYLRKAIGLLMLAVLFFISSNGAEAANYYFANGGGYWTQSGSSWNIRYNDGYCISGRGPCGSSLWKQQWTYNHAGCGFDEWGHWTISSNAVVPYVGKVSAWIDGYMGGTMPAANYSISYENGSSYYAPINQNLYYEMFVPIAQLKRVTAVDLTDSWGGNQVCNSGSGYRVEFDEIKLEV